MRYDQDSSVKLILFRNLCSKIFVKYVGIIVLYYLPVACCNKYRSQVLPLPGNDAKAVRPVIRYTALFLVFSEVVTKK